jgi:2-C-methyl-D-erythritol 4-phosphate cytidylyltransferase
MEKNTDLSVVDPTQRLDVLVFRGVEKLARFIEEKNGITGVWDAVRPHINSAVVKHVSGIEIPTEAKILLSILQANWKG